MQAHNVLLSEKLKREAQKSGHITTIFLSLASLGLAACGGGGSGGGSPVGPIDPPDDDEDNSAGDVVYSTDLPPQGNSLTLTQAGSEWFSTEFSGITHAANTSSYNVSDAPTNKYQVKLTAEGSGELEFIFADANDTITLLDGSEISGFTSINVVNGTLDLTDADLTMVDEISVASSVKVSAAQMSKLTNFISNSADGILEIEVKSKAELDAVISRIESGALKIYADITPITFKKTANSGLSDTEINTANSNAGSSIIAVAEFTNPNAGLSFSILKEGAHATLSAVNDNRYFNASETSGDIRFRVDTLDKYDVKSVILQTESGSSITLTREADTAIYSVAASEVADGEYQVIVEIEDDGSIVADELGLQASSEANTLEAKIIVDRVAPAAPEVSIEGSSNGLNAEEVAGEIKVVVAGEASGSAANLSVNGIALTERDGYFILDASTLTDGDYTLIGEFIDKAGNTFDISKAFSVDLTGPSEAVISIEGASPNLNAQEASGNVNVNVTVNSGVTIVSAKIGDTDLTPISGSTYEFDASNLSEGSHTVTFVTSDESGNEVTSTQSFNIDLTGPSDAEITIVNSDGGLSPEETVETVKVVLKTDDDATITSAKIGSINLTSISENLYEFSASGLSGGKHTLEVVSADAAGNETTTSEVFTVLGFTSSASNLFEFTTERADDVITFSLNIKNIISPLIDGIPAFEFGIDMNSAHLDFVEGSFKGAPGTLGLTNEDGAASGDFTALGIYLTPFNSWDQALFSFQAIDLGTSSSTQIALSDVKLGDYDIVDSSAFISI